MTGLYFKILTGGKQYLLILIVHKIALNHDPSFLILGI